MPSLGKVEIRPLKYVDLFLTRCGWSNLYISEKEIMALKTLRIVTKRRAWLELWKNWTLLVVKLNIRRKSSSRQSAPLWMQLLIKLSFSLFYFQTDREEVQALPRCLSIIHLHFASTLRQWWWLQWGCCFWSSDQYLKMSCLLLGPEGGWPLNSKIFLLLLYLCSCANLIFFLEDLVKFECQRLSLTAWIWLRRFCHTTSGNATSLTNCGGFQRVG